MAKKKTKKKKRSKKKSGAISYKTSDLTLGYSVVNESK